jgi:hypothetical protein
MFPRRIPPRMLGAYTFAHGDARDVTDNGRNLSLVGNASVSGGELVCDGSGDYATATTLTAVSALTFAGWVLVNNLTAELTVCVAAASSTNRSFYFSFRGDLANDPFLLWFAQTSAASPPLNFVQVNTSGQSWWGGAGVYHHVAGVIDPSLASADKSRIYVNGALRSGSATSSGGVPTAINNSGGAFALGGNAFGWPSLNGKIGEARVFSYAMTAAEISEMYNNTRRLYV